MTVGLLATIAACSLVRPARSKVFGPVAQPASPTDSTAVARTAGLNSAINHIVSARLAHFVQATPDNGAQLHIHHLETDLAVTGLGAVAAIGGIQGGDAARQAIIRTGLGYGGANGATIHRTVTFQVTLLLYHAGVFPAYENHPAVRGAIQLNAQPIGKHVGVDHRGALVTHVCVVDDDPGRNVATGEHAVGQHVLHHLIGNGHDVLALDADIAHSPGG